LVKNLKHFPEQKAFNVGVHDTLGEGILHISNNDEQSSSILALGLHKRFRPDITYVEDQKVTLVRMDDFIRDNEIDITEYNFLNVDVQGTELNVLKSFGELLSNFDYIELEVNAKESYIGCALLPEVDEYLKEFGFIKLLQFVYKMGWGDAFYKKYA
jgi:FkbM family methyltransferase